ncbi:MAG: hypothetical protein AAF363_06930 [Bacteroidota bacterium]
MRHINQFIKNFSVAILLIFVTTTCRDDDRDLLPASFPSIAEVFIDEFSPGLAFQAFAPSVLSAFQIENNIVFNGTASMRFDVPDEGNPLGSFAGGIFTVEGGRDLSGFNVLTFWASSSEAATVGEFGFGTDFGEDKFATTLRNVAVNSTWQQFFIPIPDPSVLTRERGMFLVSAGPQDGKGFSLFIDDVRFENSNNVGGGRAFIQNGEDTEIAAFTGQSVTPTGLGATFNVAIEGAGGSSGSINVSVDATIAYFNFSSSNSSVVPAGENLVVTGESGTTVITGTIGDLDSEGSLTVSAVPDAPVPFRPAADVTSVFSDAYENITVNFFNGLFGGQTTQGGNIELETGRNVISYTDLNFVAIDFQPTDVSERTFFHLDLFTLDQVSSADLKIDLIDFGANNVIGGGDDSPEPNLDGSFPGITLSSDQLATGRWVSFDIPFSEFEAIGLDARMNLGQLVLSSATLPNILIDNIYFFTFDPEADPTLIDLQIDGETIVDFDPIRREYTIILPEEATTVPSVTATPAQTEAVAVVSPAASLPGTTTVEVTAPDGITMLTYSIDFEVIDCDLEITSNIDPSAGLLDITFLNGEGALDPFGGIGGGVITNPFQTEANPSCNVFEINNLEGCADFGGSGLEFSSPINGSVFNNNQLSLLVYAETEATSITVQLERLPFPDTEPSVSDTVNISQTGVWEELVFDFGDTDGLTFKNIIVFANRGETCDGDIYYVDDIRIAPIPVNPEQDASLSDLQVDGTTVTGFSAATLTYNVELPEGTTTVPTVTATTSQTGANAVVTAATELPGTTTVVVTAQDGITTQTYNIQFTVGSGGGGDAPTVAAPTPVDRDAADVISLFSNAYMNITVDTFFAGFSQGGGQTNEQVAGDDVLRYEDLDFAGIETTSTVVDLTGMTNFSIDVWTATEFDFIAGIVDFGGDGFEGASADTRGDVQETLSAGQWTTIDVTIADLQAAGLTANPADFSQLILDVVDVTGTIFVDNIFFYNDGSGGGSMDILLESFDAASSVDSWIPVADADANPGEVTLAFNATQGNPDGALELSGSNTTTVAGRAYIFQNIFNGLDFTGVSDVQLTFDVRLGAPLTAAAIQLETEIQGQGVVNTNDIQNLGLNESTFTTVTVDYPGVSAGANTFFRISFNIASGAVVGAGTTLFIDNIRLAEGSGSGGGGGGGGTPATFPLDFEDGVNFFNAFEGASVSVISNPQTVGNPSSMVLELVKPNGSPFFAGVNSDQTLNGPTIDLSNGLVFTVRVWSPLPNNEFRMRLEQEPGVIDPPAFELFQTVTNANEWTTLTFDFSTTPAQSGFSYTRMVLNPGWNVNPSTGETYFIDDITQQ